MELPFSIYLPDVEGDAAEITNKVLACLISGNVRLKKCRRLHSVAHLVISQFKIIYRHMTDQDLPQLPLDAALVEPVASGSIRVEVLFPIVHHIFDAHLGAFQKLYGYQFGQLSCL